MEQYPFVCVLVPNKSACLCPCDDHNIQIVGCFPTEKEALNLAMIWYGTVRSKESVTDKRQWNSGIFTLIHEHVFDSETKFMVLKFAERLSSDVNQISEIAEDERGEQEYADKHGFVIDRGQDMGDDVWYDNTLSSWRRVEATLQSSFSSADAWTALSE